MPPGDLPVQCLQASLFQLRGESSSSPPPAFSPASSSLLLSTTCPCHKHLPLCASWINVGLCVLTACSCLSGSVGGAISPLRITALWITRNLLLLLMIYLLLLTNESGQGYPWIESYQFHLLMCDVFAEGERERAGTVLHGKLSPYLILVPAGG